MTVLTALVISTVVTSGVQDSPDLVITGATVLDVRTGEVEPGRTVVITGNRITAILDAGAPVPTATRSLDARGRLLTPGLIDVHGHLDYVLGDSVSAGGGYITHLHDTPDSLAAYRRRYSDACLPYGVTTVREAGAAEADLRLLADWMQPAPGFPDFFPVGGALISYEEGRTPFPGHAVVRDSADAVAKVRLYLDLGYRHLKLYWRLREPELRAALAEARRLGMNLTGHIDFHVVPFARTLDLGLRSFEHAYTVGVGAMTDDEYTALWRTHVPAVYGERRNGLFHLAMMEVFNQLGPSDPEALTLIERLAATGSTVSSTLHIFAQQVGAAWFRLPSGEPFDDISGLTPEQAERAAAGYRILAGYVRRMHESGVRLTLGTDWKEPGRVALSEMTLLHQAGIPMPDVFRIATLNGAASLGLEDVGVVEPGFRANLVLFHRDPLGDPGALFGERTVIKDGRLVAHQVGGR